MALSALVLTRRENATTQVAPLARATTRAAFFRGFHVVVLVFMIVVLSVDGAPGMACSARLSQRKIRTRNQMCLKKNWQFSGYRSASYRMLRAHLSLDLSCVNDNPPACPDGKATQLPAR